MARGLLLISAAIACGVSSPSPAFAAAFAQHAVSSSEPSILLSSNTIGEGAELGPTGLFFAVFGQDGPHQWSLVENGGGTWGIDAASGELLLLGPLDFETTGTYIVQPQATNGWGAGVVQSFTIDVTDVPSASEVGIAAENGATIPLFGSVRESAFYNASLDTTVFAWEAFVDGSRQAHVSTYDHTNGTFGPIVNSGIPGLTDDDHGVPAIVQDHQGYGHLFGGSHFGSQRMQHAVTDAPNDFSAWTVQASLPRDYAYPHPVLVGETLYLFMRRGSAGQTKLVLRTTTALDNGAATWGSEQAVIDLGENPPTVTKRVYAGNFQAVGTEIWFVAQLGSSSDSERENVYFFRFDTVTGSVSNFDGSETILAADLPVERAEADADFMLYEHTGTDKGTDIPVWLLDHEDRAHIFFGVGPNEGPFDVMHMSETGSGWSTPEAVASVTGRFDVFAPVLRADGSIQLYYPSPWHDDWRDLDFPLDGEIMLKTRSPAGAWSVARKIIEGEEYSIGRVVPILDGHSSARVMFTELADGNLDSMAGGKRLFIYGDNGFLSAAAPLGCPTSPVTPGSSFSSTVTGGGSASDRVASFLPGAPNTSWIGQYEYVPLPRPASVTMTAPTAAGTYELRLLANRIGSCTYQVAAGPVPALSINDVTLAEGHSGTTAATFNVTLSPTATGTVTVSFATANGTASAGSDYVANYGTLTFNPEETVKTITVTVNGDTTPEDNETFFVNLSTPSGATIADNQGQGTITNDDLPTLSINDVTVTEGHSGTTSATFNVTLSPAATETVTVAFVTANGTATAGSDYVAGSGTLTFTAGQIVNTVVVTVNGDTDPEANEMFFVNLSAPSGATISDNQGIGMITSDDGTSQAVAWTSLVGVTASGNTLTKTAAGGWGNAGAVSTKSLISGDGFVEVTVSGTNTHRMFGLGNGDTNTNYADIEFGFLLIAGGTVQLYESGVSRGNFGTYVSGDRVQVAVEGGAVKFKRNGVTLYTSTRTPTYPLLVDTALSSQGATLSAHISGSWAPTPPPPPPSGEAVAWTSLVGVTASGNTLTKTAAGGWGNAGAVSTKSLISGDGFVEVTVSGTNTHRMFGLGNGDTNTNYADIEFGFLLIAGGTVQLYESGVSRGNFGVFASGDRVQVAVEGGTVKFKRNGVTLYTSTRTPTYPLLVDTALSSQGATLSAHISGNWGSAPPPPPPPGEAVAWTSLVGVTASGNTLTKTAAGGWGNAGAVSTKSLISGDGFVEVTVNETNTHRMFGLGNGDTNANYTDIEFGFLLIAGGKVQIYESGTSRGNFGGFASGDTVQVAVEGGTVKFKRNGVTLYTSTRTPTYPLLVDTALSSQGATLSAWVSGPWQ